MRWLREPDARLPRLATVLGLLGPDTFIGLARSASRLPVDTAWLDGEVVVMDAQGRSSFQAMQNDRRYAFAEGDPGRAEILAFIEQDIELPSVNRKVRA